LSPLAGGFNKISPSLAGC